MTDGIDIYDMVPYFAVAAILIAGAVMIIAAIVLVLAEDRRKGKNK